MNTIKIKSTLKARVKYTDTDSMGVMNNGAYNDFLESARTELMRKKILSLKELESSGLYLPLVEAKVKYLSPARYDDELIILTTCCISKESPYILFKSKIKREDTIISIGITKHIFVDINSFRCKKLPNNFLSKL